MLRLLANLPGWFKIATLVLVVLIAIWTVTFLWLWLFGSDGHESASTSGAAPASGAAPSAAPPDEQRTLAGKPDIILAESPAELCMITGVRDLHNLESSRPIGALPKGVRGYTESYNLDTLPVRLGNEPAALRNDTPIRSQREFAGDVEVHRSMDGTVYVAVYVPEEVRIQAVAQQRAGELPITVTFRKYKQFADLVAIPRERLVHWRHRRFGDGEEAADCRIT